MLSLNKVQLLADNSEHCKENIDQALDRSSHELQLLANFYHQHGYEERAQDVCRVVVRINNDRYKRRNES